MPDDTDQCIKLTKAIGSSSLFLLGYDYNPEDLN